VTVWIVKAGEPTPLDPGAPRLMRAGRLAKHLAERGHSVVWWTAAFDHQRKQFRTPDSGAGTWRDGVELRLIDSPGYSKNVSVRRWWDDVRLAWSMSREMRRSANPPDVIVCAYPLIFVSLAVVRFKRRGTNAVVLLDVRDMWPDIYASAGTRLRSRLYAAFAAIHWPIVHTIFRGADGITGITEPFLEWALGLAERSRTALDGVFPLSSSPAALTSEDRAAAREFFKQRGISDRTKNFCYFGSISDTVDLRTVVEAGRLLERRGDIRLVLCGSGDRHAGLAASASGLRSTVLPGFVDASRIRALMEMSIAGLAPYRNRPDFLASVPNKVIEYLSCGLPVIAGIEGLVGQLVESCGCGVKYPEGDAAALARVVCELADDPARAAAMGQRASAVYEERYSASVVYGRFADHVERATRTAIA
jgi:glycosyltransferase involved in cell wall biosynthesis